jgi:hypothetical protein
VTSIGSNVSICYKWSYQKMKISGLITKVDVSLEQDDAKVSLCSDPKHSST